MKHTAERRAITGAVLGIVTVVLALVPARWVPLLVVPLGIFVVVRSLVVLVTALRSPTPTSWRVIVGTVLGGCFGGMAILLCAALAIGRIVSEANGRPWEQNQFGRGAESMPRAMRAETTATNFTSNLPIVVVHANGQYISDFSTLARAQFFDVDAGTRRASVGAAASHDGDITIHVRGSSSKRLPKSSYTFHTVVNRTNQVKVPLLGLPKEEDWVLYAPFEDKTMIRDVLAFELARRSGHYAPRTRFVELFMTSSPGPLTMRDYAGVYVLVEKIKRGPDRVDIAKLDREAGPGADLSGGYIIKRDHQDRGAPRFSTGHGGPYFFVYPDARRVTSEQRSWLAGYFRSFEAALYGPDFADPATGYAAYLDVDSFIDAHWLIEMSKNVDGFRYSAFITKDRGGKLKTEPPWDWNRSFGNANYYGGWQTSGWYWTRLRPNEISWFHRLQEDPEFMRRLNARWSELRRDAFETQKMLALVDQFAAELQESQVRNFKRWPILGERVTCNHFVGDTYEEEIQWLKKWIVDRTTWIDRQAGAQRGVPLEPDSGERDK